MCVVQVLHCEFQKQCWKSNGIVELDFFPQQRQNTISRASLISLDGESYHLQNTDNDSKRRYISDENTYILALDGDTDFQPEAVILLVDRLRMYDCVGAACGRIHPTGMGNAQFILVPLWQYAVPLQNSIFYTFAYNTVL